MGVTLVKSGGKSSSGSQNNTCKGTVAAKVDVGGIKEPVTVGEGKEERIHFPARARGHSAAGALHAASRIPRDTCILPAFCFTRKN